MNVTLRDSYRRSRERTLLEFEPLLLERDEVTNCRSLANQTAEIKNQKSKTIVAQASSLAGSPGAPPSVPSFRAHPI